jgi:toxin ParE1/3/4
MKYEFHPDAEEEFIDAAAYYERNVTGLGERFGSEVRHAIERLLEYPELGAPIDAALRRLMLPRFPYFLIYSFTPDLLRVVAVAHTRRRPGYWRSRTNQ